MQKAWEESGRNDGMGCLKRRVELSMCLLCRDERGVWKASVRAVTAFAIRCGLF